jgi:hypothetical protein
MIIPPPVQPPVDSQLVDETWWDVKNDEKTDSGVLDALRLST